MVRPEKESKKIKIRKGDTVRILLGRDRGKKGKVMMVLPKEQKLVVEGVNVVKKHVRPRRAGEKGQRVSIAAPMHVSNVQLVCPQCKKRTRIGIKREGSERHRVCRKCKVVID